MFTNNYLSIQFSNWYNLRPTKKKTSSVCIPCFCCARMCDDFFPTKIGAIFCIFIWRDSHRSSQVNLWVHLSMRSNGYRICGPISSCLRAQFAEDVRRDSSSTEWRIPCRFHFHYESAIESPDSSLNSTQNLAQITPPARHRRYPFLDFCKWQRLFQTPSWKSKRAILSR